MTKVLTKKETEDLRLVLAHEYRRCDQAFIDFLENSANLIGMGWSKNKALSTFDSYARFIHHLYEFYVGCFKRNRGSLENIKYDELDTLFQSETEKLMGLRRWRIEHGDVNKSENHISYYQEPVPENFAEDFRRIRNRLAHADFRRSGAKDAMTLHEFFEGYQKFVILLYEEPYWLWHVKADSHDWGEIEKFGRLASNNSSTKSPSSYKKKLNDFLFYRKIKKAISYRRRNSN